jgi:hypothetical protein
MEASDLELAERLWTKGARTPQLLISKQIKLRCMSHHPFCAFLVSDPVMLLPLLPLP